MKIIIVQIDDEWFEVQKEEFDSLGDFVYTHLKTYKTEQEARKFARYIRDNSSRFIPKKIAEYEI